MRNLNSILLEGDLIDQPISSTGRDGVAQCTFSLTSGENAPSVPIIAFHKLATRCSGLLDKGSSIRIVGRIAQDLEASVATGSFCLRVIAEHVEIKPKVSSRAEVA
jgi:single-stranded DNA-binding protein